MISRSTPRVYSKVRGTSSFSRQSLPWASMPVGPQGVPKVFRLGPPLYTQSRE